MRITTEPISYDPCFLEVMRENDTPAKLEMLAAVQSAGTPEWDRMASRPLTADEQWGWLVDMRENASHPFDREYLDDLIQRQHSELDSEILNWHARVLRTLYGVRLPEVYDRSA